ncbi:unnamed protein product [Ascophyllum nodosum]
MSRDPVEARKELDELSEIFPSPNDVVSEGEEASNDEEYGRRRVPKERWGTIDGYTPNERFFARMQGAKPGERMTTAVKTQAEKDKFDREAFQFLITPEVRRQLGGHPAIQAIDFDRFAEKWNEDVGEMERNEVAGRLEVSGDANKKINRKAPSTCRTGGPSRRRTSTPRARWSRTKPVYQRCTEEIASIFQSKAQRTEQPSA